MIVPEGAKSADAPGQEDDRVSSGPVDDGLLGDDTDGEGKCEDLEEDTNSLLPDTLDHFKNLYITKPPPVILRDHSGKWYSFPWRVVRSYEVNTDSTDVVRASLTFMTRAGHAFSPEVFYHG